MATDAKKLSYWQQHFKRCQASGLTRHAYCAREGFALSTFDHWRRLCRNAPDRSRSAALTLVPVHVPRNAQWLVEADIKGFLDHVNP